MCIYVQSTNNNNNNNTLYTHIIPDIGKAVRVFTNSPVDLGSILGRIIPKTQKKKNGT